MVTPLQLLKQIEVAYKNAPGRHDQRSHAPNVAKASTQIVDSEGNPLEVYHGTMHEFDEFNPGKMHRTMQLGFGIHFAEQPDFAELYATDEKGRKGKVVRAILKANNMLDATQIVKEGTPEFSLAKKLGGSRLYTARDENGVRGAYLQTAIDMTSPARAEKLIKEAGYDAVKYESIYGGSVRPSGHRNISGKSISYVVFDPSQIIILDKE